MSSAGYSSSTLEQVIAIHSGMAAEWAGLVSSHAKSVEVPRDWAHSGQSFPWLSKTLRFSGYGSIFVNVCGDEALCSSEDQGNLRLCLLGSLLGFWFGSFIAGDPNMTWDPL
ncbi:hypothetical protein TNCV_1409151 [Trichonephila clavipes]|uniref:Uncharacterized protein n=1 Tax=Trichonephila clavipes TaxID=2585209 RepID=A0A8X6UX05_TRICX|nr:hypothetical protein TNCV_1409151 [Trichonephila clavipes]